MGRFSPWVDGFARDRQARAASPRARRGPDDEPIQAISLRYLRQYVPWRPGVGSSNRVLGVSRDARETLSTSALAIPRRTFRVCNLLVHRRRRAHERQGPNRRGSALHSAQPPRVELRRSRSRRSVLGAPAPRGPSAQQLHAGRGRGLGARAGCDSPLGRGPRAAAVPHRGVQKLPSAGDLARRTEAEAR